VTVRRQVAQVDPDLCNACGSCVSACLHDALEFAGGHARLVNEALCEGDGLCADACGGAMTLVLRDASPFDQAAVDRRREKRARLRALAGED
jgi:MinD superfamily P-loop ATPase